jgi:hypothetical protein
MRRTQSSARGKNVRHKLLGLFFVPAIDDSALRAVRITVLGLVSAREQRDFAAAFRGIPRRSESSEAAAND